MTTHEDDDDALEVSYISVVCIDSLSGRGGKDLHFMTHFNDDDIPLV
jgi:hypothetical protein